jgi:hydroxycarboxylate dehydrogenase B
MIGTSPMLHTALSLTNTVSLIVKAMGSTAQEATMVAENLVEANLRGHDSHGVGMIPRYVEAFLEGGLTINQRIQTVQASGSLLTLDGGQGFGQTMGYAAMNLAIEVAKRDGVCVLGLRNSHHLGRIGHWAEQAAAMGLVSIHFVNVLARPIVAPWGGRDARHGTNPFCVGIPRPGQAPVILDFATSRIAQGKTRVAFNKGEALAEGILIDDQGEPTTNPRYSVIEPAGAILPFGEHKGSGLALICELLGGALAGGATWHQAADSRRQVLNGMFSIVVDPQRLGTAQHLAKEMEDYIAWHTASPAVDAEQGVLIAGDAERRYKAERLKNGIDVDDTTWQEIVKAGQKVGIA